MDNNKMIIGLIASLLNETNETKILEQKKQLEEITKSFWTLYQNKFTRLVRYELLFELNEYFLNKRKNRNISLGTDTRNVNINLDNYTIETVNFGMEKSCLIKLNKNKELSDELYDFICEFYFDDDIKLNLDELSEKYEIETDLDFSGLH